MKYELALELKNAGYKLPNRGWGVLEKCTCERIDGVHDPYTNCFLFAPTLEEIIEACGDIEFTIHCYPKGHGTDVTNAPWFVIERPGLMDMQRCPTPREAVIRLWLALNKK